MESFKFKVGESIWCPSIVGNGNPIEIIEVIDLCKKTMIFEKINHL